MINGLEGINGSGKSYEAVAYHVLSALQRGRKVVTNLPLVVAMFAASDSRFADLIEVRRYPQPVRGVWDKTAAGRDEPAFKLFEDGHTEPAPDGVDMFGHVWDFYDEWKGPDGNGPLFVIDECHIPFPVIGTDPAIVQWFKIHRHFNVDVLLMTQSFRDMNQPIARLIAMLIKCRKADILGKADHYIRKVHGGYRGGVVSTEQRKYRPEMFALYRSHTQGNSVAEAAAQDVAPFLVKFTRFSRAVYVVGAVAMVYAFWPEGKPTPAPKAVTPGTIQRSAAPLLPVGAPRPAASAPVKVVAVKDVLGPDQIPEPLGTKALHLTGKLVLANRTLYTFSISAGGARQSDVTSEELSAMGYSWEPLTHCAGTLRWKDRARPVVCDAPQLAVGVPSMPVVIQKPAQAPS